MNQPRRATNVPQIAAMVAETEAQVLRRMRLLALAAFVMVGWFWMHALSVTLTVQLGCSLALLAATWLERAPLVGRKLLLLAGALGVAACGLVEFGPLLGSGVVIVVVTMMATFFFGRRGAIVVTTTVLVLMGAIAVAAALSLIHPAANLGPSIWARVVTVSALGVIATAILSRRLFGAMRASLVAEKLAHAAEAAAQREREMLLKQSMVSQSLASVGRLAGGIAHDFNNTLMVLRCGIDFLRDATTLGAEERAVIEELVGAVETATGTTRQLLAFSKPRAETAGSCVVATVLERVAASVRRFLPESIAVAIGARTTRSVRLPSSGLEQALLNLVINARDAMPRGGAITLAAEDDGGAGGVRISVADTGQGLTDEVRTRMFEPFFTTKKDRGTGLGLTMVEALVKQVDGTIEVASSPGHGTTITLCLPSASAPSRDEDSASGAAPRSPLAEVGATRRRVLLLEDQPEVLRSMARILIGGGYWVQAFDRAAPALASLALARYDLLLTDVVVPGGGVAELIAAFGERNPAAPVLVCSGHVDEELVATGIDAGRYNFLRKPFSADELLAAVRRLPSP